MDKYPQRETQRETDRQTNRQTETNRQTDRENSKTLFHKDCSLDSIKSLTTLLYY